MTVTEGLRTSDTIAELAAALAEAQGKFPVIEKTKTAKVPTKAGGEYSYSYADLAEVVKQVAPVASAHGLAVLQMPGYDPDLGHILTTRVMHKSGEWIEGWMLVPVPHEVAAQALGSGITYARRYAYGPALGIVTEVDDDGKGAHDSRSSGTRKPAQSSNQGTTRTRPSPTPPQSNADEPPPRDPDGDPPPAPRESGELASEPQLKKIHVQFRELDMADKFLQQEYASQVAGRPIASSKELTKREASAVIEKQIADLGKVEQ